MQSASHSDRHGKSSLYLLDKRLVGLRSGHKRDKGKIPIMARH
jgi:hypothetical protein